MLHMDTQSRSKASASQSRFRSAASYDVLSAIRRSKNLSSPSNRQRDYLLLELHKQYPLSQARLFHKTELEKFDKFIFARDMPAARTVAVNTLSAFQAEMTAFSETLFNTFASKGEDYKRIMAAWHLFAVMTPLTRDTYWDANCLTAGQKRDLFSRSASSYHFEKEPKRAVEHKPPTIEDIKQSLHLQESFEQLHRLLRPLICTICHTRVTVWTFLEHTNVCYEYEMGKRTLLSVNKDLLKLCEEAQTESLKLNIRLLPDAELELENDIFGRCRADILVSTYKKSYISDHSKKSNALSPEKGGRKESFLGDAFETHRPGGLASGGGQAVERSTELNIKEANPKGQLWGGRPQNNPYFLRAMAHANEFRLGLNKLSDTDFSKDRSSKRDSIDSKGEAGYTSSLGSGSYGQSGDKKDKRSTLAGPDLIRIPSNSSLSKNNAGEAEEDLLGDAFFGNDDANSSGKNSLDRSAGGSRSAGENQSISRHSNEKQENEFKSSEFRPALSPKRFKESLYPILGVIDEEDENFASKRQISPVINSQESKTHFGLTNSGRFGAKRLLDVSPMKSPDFAPHSPSFNDDIDDFDSGKSKSKILGGGLDSSSKFILPQSAFSGKNKKTSSLKKQIMSSQNPSFNLYRRPNGSKKSLTFNKPTNPILEVSEKASPRASPKASLKESPKSPPKATSAPESPYIDLPRVSVLKDETGDSQSPSRRKSSQSSFKKSFRGFQQGFPVDPDMYFQPKPLPEAPGSAKDDSPNAERRIIASKSPIKKVSMNTSTMYTKNRADSDTFGIWTTTFTPNNVFDNTPVEGDSPSPPKSTIIPESDRMFDQKMTRSGPTAQANPFSFRNSLSTSGKNKDGDNQSASRHTGQSSIQKSAFADSSASSKPSRFPACRTEWKPVQIRAPKPLDRKEVPFEVRRNIWIEANKAATEYRKPQSKKAANQDHLVYILNKRIQEYKSGLISLSIVSHYKAEKDLIFDLGLVKDRFDKEARRQLVGRFIDALKARIDLIEQQHKKQSMIGDLERDFQAKRVFRNKISVSYSNLRILEVKSKRKPKALTALNFEIVDGKIQKKRSTRESQPPQMFLQKLLKMEESSRNVSSVRKKSLENEKFWEDKHLESKSDVDTSQQKKMLEHDTSLGDGLSVLSSASKDDHHDEFLNGPPLDLDLHKKKVPETAREVSQPKAELPLIEKMISGKTERRVMKKHPSDSKILEIAEREKLYFEHTKEVCLDNFEFLKEIGKGAFGRVYLTTHKPTREIYALKIIQFQEEVSKKFLEEMQNEISILNVIEGEFLAKAMFSFVDRHCLCIAMEYLIGGDFRNVLETECRLDVKATQWYIAQLCLAVEELHSQNIVHRDLKPENILLDKDLKLKLADFGLSEFRKKVDLNVQVSGENIVDPRHKKVATKTQSQEKRLVGTPDYIPPEVLQASEAPSDRKLEETGQSGDSNKKSPRETFMGDAFFETKVDSLIGVKPIPEERTMKQSIARRMNVFADQQLDEMSSAIDWWGVGCLLYEFLVGVSPFGATTLDEVWHNIRTFNIIWPDIGYGEDMMIPEAHDLILRFLDRDPLKRIGVKGFQEIQSHPFFKGLDWSTLSTGTAPLSLDVKLPAPSKNIKMSIVVPRKPPSMPTSRFDGQDLVISRLDLFYELNIKKVLQVRETHTGLLSGHLQLLDRKGSTFALRDLPILVRDQRDPESPEL